MASINPKKYYRKLNLRFHPDKINSADEQMLQGLGLTFDKIESFFGVVGPDKKQAFPFLYSKEELDRSTIKGLIAYAEKFENLDIEAQSAVLDRLVNKERFNRSENFLNEYANYETKCVKLHIEKGNGDWVDLVEDKSLLEGSGITRKAFEKIEGLVLEAVGRDEGRDAYKKFLDSVATLYQHCFKPETSTSTNTLEVEPTATEQNPTAADPAATEPTTSSPAEPTATPTATLTVTTTETPTIPTSTPSPAPTSTPTTAEDPITSTISPTLNPTPDPTTTSSNTTGTTETPTSSPTAPTPSPTPPASIIDALKDLAEGKVLPVASVGINGETYSIEYAKASSDANTTINVISRTITVTKGTMPSNDAALKAEIETIKIGLDGEQPVIDPVGNAIVCPGAAPYDCTEIKFSILYKLTRLKDGEGLHIANVPVDKELYVLKYLKAAVDAPAILDTISHTITVTKAIMPSDNASLKDDIRDIKAGGDRANPQIDLAAGEAIECDYDFAALYVPDTCNAINLKDHTHPFFKKLEATVEPFDNKNKANEELLMNSIGNLIIHGEEAVHGAASFIVTNPIKFSAQQIEKIVESYKEAVDSSVIHTADKAKLLMDCMEFGLC